jgi:hypothetical protein
MEDHMKRPQCRSWLLGVALLSVWLLEPVSAISPSFVIVYGDRIANPVVIQCRPDSSPDFLWNTARGGTPLGTSRRGTIPSGLSSRPYLKVAILWGHHDSLKVRPEDASQHVRLYLPTPSEPAVVITTAIAPDRQFSPQQVPEDLSGFLAGWVLSAEDVADAKRLGIPGL